MSISDSQSNFKRFRFTQVNTMESETIKARFVAVKEEVGRDIIVFETFKPSVAPPKESADVDETDEFYELTAADYYRITASKKEEKFLKTKKIREAEEAARRAKITKTTIRVRFPDNITLEATFHPSETFESLMSLLLKVISHPELPFYLYTTPPKRQIKDLSQDFYSAEFIPGAIVYFSYDTSKGDIPEDITSGPYLREDMLSLKDLAPIPKPPKPVDEPTSESFQPVPEPAAAPSRKPADKKSVKPKWLKM